MAVAGRRDRMATSDWTVEKPLRELPQSVIRLKAGFTRVTPPDRETDFLR